MSNSSIGFIDRTLSDATTPRQRGPGSDGNEEGTPHSLKLQHYWSLTIRLFNVISKTLVGGWSYPSAEMQSVYSTVPSDWAGRFCFFLNIFQSIYPSFFQPERKSLKIVGSNPFLLSLSPSPPLSLSLSFIRIL